MRLRTLIRAMAISCLMATPLAFGLGGCKKKPRADSKVSPESKESPSKNMPVPHDGKLHMDSMGQKTDALDGKPDSMGPNPVSMEVMGAAPTKDPPRPTDPSVRVGETPGKPGDGGVVNTKGHKGMLPMKGLVDPAD